MTAHSLAEVIRKGLDSRLDNVHTAMPCKVLAYDPTTMTVNCEPQVQRPIFDDDDVVVYEDLPALMNVPVAYLRGTSSQFAITWPLAPGDHVLVIFCEQDISGWRNTGGKSRPEYLRTHGLHSGIAIPCVGPNLDIIPAAAQPAMVITATELLLGSMAATMHVALAEMVSQRFGELYSVVAGWTPVANDGGAALKAAFTAGLTSLGWSTTGVAPIPGALTVKAV